MPLRPPLRNSPAAPLPAQAIRPVIANWFAQTEPKPRPARERVQHIRLALDAEGGFVISFRSDQGGEHVFEIADLDTLTDGIAMKRALRENTDLRLDAPPNFWRNSVIPWLLNDAAQNGEGYFEVRPVPDRRVA